MKNHFDYKIAIVTGGASGIGYAIAKKFVQNHVKVILIGRNKTRLKLACETLGVLAGFVGCDLAELTKLPEIVNKIREDYGRIDILVNNAGMHLRKSIKDVTDEDYQKVWDIKGKLLNTPLYNLIGGKSREKVLVYAHANGKNTDETLQNIGSQIEKGFQKIINFKSNFIISKYAITRN